MGIPPDEARSLFVAVTADLRDGGRLSQRLSGYEERPAQIAMATLVTEALGQESHVIAEASTGTGKSYAYLIPLVRSGKVAIVSTANKALQEQLFYKDIPFVQQHIKHVEAALVKGVNNYVCLDRLDDEQQSGLLYHTQRADFQRVLAVAGDQECDWDGDFETLPFFVPPEIRSRINGDSDQCAWSKCDFFSQCYIRQMRARARQAQILVVNHTLLLLDAATEGQILPERSAIVVDEAHALEEVATEVFTVRVRASQVYTLLSLKTLRTYTPVDVQDEVVELVSRVWNDLEQRFADGGASKIRFNTPIEDGLQLASRIEDLATALRQRTPRFDTEKEEVLYEKLVKRTEHLAENVRLVFSVQEPQQYVYYLERNEATRKDASFVEVAASPLDVSDLLKRHLFAQCAVICTSATLASVSASPGRPEEKGSNFAYFRRRVGLDPVERPNVLERVLPLAFDYESNALLYVPRDVPEPAYGSSETAVAYTLAVARKMYALVQASRGRAFLLFSSRRMLERAYELMSPHLDFPLLKQGDMTRIELTRRFRQEEGAVLFGLKSFWEGVDIAGDALSLVVIDKLPFDPPDDPVHEARVALMKAAGENWFGTYVLPQAVLRLKQGVGRLIRTHEDRGVMAILDARLHTKGYGKLVLNALPPAKRTSSLKEVKMFFE